MVRTKIPQIKSQRIHHLTLAFDVRNVPSVWIESFPIALTAASEKQIQPIRGAVWYVAAVSNRSITHKIKNR